ncbi:LPS translocon maturation chaperone LptM [Chitinimonas koreensis]|nr:lipoprotein [Chitinimonas koreensis]
MRLLVLCLIASLLAACGYKGPLYLPKPDQTSSSPKTPAP